MGSDRIAVLRGRHHGALDWTVYRRGPSVVLQSGHLADSHDVWPEELRSKRAGAVTQVLPASQVVIRVMTFPLLDAEELAGAVGLQVDKFSPFPVEQMVYGYEVLAEEPEKIAVLIAISQLTSVMSWGNPIRQAGAHIERVDCMTLGLWVSLRASGALDLERRESFLLIDSDEVVLITHDCGRLLAISGLGSSSSLGNTVGCEDLAEEISRILVETDAENGTGLAPHAVIAAHDEIPTLAALQACLAETLDIPVDKMEGQAFPDAAAGVLQRSNVLPHTPAPLNLIPAEWVKAAASQRSRRQLVSVGAGLLAVWLLLLGGGWGYMAWQRARLGNLQMAAAQWAEAATVVSSLRAQALIIDQYRDRSHSALESLREISALQPEGVDLISFTYRKGEGIELVGEATAGNLVLQFNQKLNESALFYDVRPGTRTTTQQGRHRFRFDIRFGEETP